ncbi:hypothetical protein BC829DRAFT_381618 [Chytridium lagenaria]|nr:hypothetical protein BC829DRAFT_381618 [Chytridium lagenaria]
MKHYTDRTNTIVSSSPLNPCPAIAIRFFDVCVFKKNSQRQKLAVEAAPISETDMVNLGKLVDFAQDSIGLEIGVPASKQNIALSLTDKFLAVKLIETNPTLKNAVESNFNENVTDTSGIVYSFCKAVLKLIYFVGLFVIFLSTVTRALYPRFVDANISRAPVNAKPDKDFQWNEASSLSLHCRN